MKKTKLLDGINVVDYWQGYGLGAQQAATDRSPAITGMNDSKIAGYLAGFAAVLAISLPKMPAVTTRSGTCGKEGNRCEWMAGALCEPRIEGRPFLERGERPYIGCAGFAGVKWFVEFCPGCGKKLEF